MLVDLQRIIQEVDLDGGGIGTYVQIQLPTGQEIKLQLEPQDAQALINLKGAGLPEESEEPQHQEEVQQQLEDPGGTVDFEPEKKEAADSDGIDWANLPNDVLAPEMKEVMKTLGVAPLVPMDDLVQLVDDISERMAAQAAQESLSTPPRMAQQPPPPQPQVGRVQVQQVPPRRTVPKDEMGNPVVPYRAGHVVPSEGTDEDGVAQL